MQPLVLVLRLSFEMMAIRFLNWLPWILLLAALYLLYQIPRMRLARRRRQLIRQLEQKRGSRVIAMIHREGSIPFLGGNSSSGQFEAEAFLKIVREIPPEKPIDLILHTPGGRIYAAAQIGRALKNHPAAVRAIVPHWAMSGGTFLSLVADEMIMDKNAILGPVDPQFSTGPLKAPVAAASVLRVIREKAKDEIEDETWIMVDQAEKLIGEMEGHIYDALVDRMGPEKARELARTMTHGQWTHAYPFHAQALTDMGLKVSTDVPEEAYELLDAFPRGAKFRSVQWLPGKKKEATEED